MDSENCPFSQFLRRRIIEYGAFGLWMHAHPNRTDDKNHIANILFIEAGCFTQAMRDSRLTSKSGDRISYNNFDMLLGFTTYFETIYPVKDSEFNSKVSIKLKVFKFYDSNSMVPENIEGPFAETSKTSLERHFNVHQNVQSLSYESLRKLLQDCRDESEKEAAESGEDDDDDDDINEEALDDEDILGDNDTCMETDSAIAPDQNLETLFFHYFYHFFQTGKIDRLNGSGKKCYPHMILYSNNRILCS